MRNLFIVLGAFFSVNLFATPGMPKSARFLFDPTAAETVVNLGEIDLAQFKVSKCINIPNAHAGLETSSWASGITYSGTPLVIAMGQQKYEMIPTFGQMSFGIANCEMELINIRSIRLSFQNKRLPENQIDLEFSFDPRTKGLAGIYMPNVTYRGTILSYY